MKSDRYRFWRTTITLVISMVLGGVVGYLTAIGGGNFTLNQFQIQLTSVQYLVTTLSLILFALFLYYLAETKKQVTLMKEETDDERVEVRDRASGRAYSIASILMGLITVTLFLTLGIMGQVMMTGEFSTLLFAQFVLISILVIVTTSLCHRSFKLLHGQKIPRNLSVKEMRDFTMSLMDEAEKQIQYEESFELVLRLNGYVFPFIYIGLLLLSSLYDLDITLTLFVLAGLQAFIVLSQYRIIKRYYK
ncbi:hypothetical protein STRDD10_00674 [Streptococcus sp. DD10]|uniref:DUF3169 family protein n=1 Tax=Streptococcus sp. DD10 TaxID=1777878 RepID=UPI000799723E|nr:DUF3169 family protein [Streptococcus sp. DD10]KXT74834.1 hypothetical protein STRDD10_00674 [Streptococcus sp. DD10]